MKLEQQVVSLELAKRLKELGVKQNSAFWWQELQNGKGHLIIDTTDSFSHVCFSAFSVAELGEMLPKKYFPSFDFLGSGKNKYRVICHVNTKKYGWHHEKKCADTEADARAKMLIYLLENKLIKS